MIAAQKKKKGVDSDRYRKVADENERCLATSTSVPPVPVCGEVVTDNPEGPAGALVRLCVVLRNYPELFDTAPGRPTGAESHPTLKGFLRPCEQ